MNVTRSDCESEQEEKPNLSVSLTRIKDWVMSWCEDATVTLRVEPNLAGNGNKKSYGKW